jgi:hypothetical protein
MTNKDRLIEMIENLNESGIDLLLYLFGDMDKKERYNKNTTSKRIVELQQIEKQLEEQRKSQFEEERKRVSFEMAQTEYRRQKEFKASLTGKEKRFFEVIEGVNPGSRYCMNYWEMCLLADVYNNSLLDGNYDIFRYGFLKGQRAEINKRKSDIQKQ